MAGLLLKVEAVSIDPFSDTFVNLNDSLAANMRSRLGSNGTCSNNGSCSNNTTCQNNDICNSNTTCSGTRPLPKDVDTEGPGM